MVSFCHCHKISFTKCKIASDLEEKFKIHDKITFKTQIISFLKLKNVTMKHIEAIPKALSANYSLRDSLKTVEYTSDQTQDLSLKFMQESFDKNGFSAT